MIIKGKSRAGPTALASHLGNAEKNERVQLLETRGTIAFDLRGALIEMDAYAAGTRCEKSLYHAALSPEPSQRLTPDQRIEAVDALEEKLGLTGHARVIVLHEKLGREHIHVVWSRIDLEHMRTVHDGHNYRKHEETARDLERRFGHERVQGAHAEREGVARPDRTPSRAELRQEERTGITGKQVKQEVSEAFRASDSPEAFRAALAERGYQVARGDRRDFVIVDRAGGIHSLARRIDIMKAADLRTFMAPLDGAQIPNIDEARSQLEDARHQARHADEEGLLEKAYSRGGYVSQAEAARREHDRRQARLDQRNDADALWDRIDEGEASRERQRSSAKAADDEPPGTAKDDVAVRGDVEITDAMQARIDRLREFKSAYAAGPPRDRQNEASGGGRTRSR
jgi:hypothetical protein